MAKGIKTGGNNFKPGESGNPKGRPQGTLSLVSLIKKKLEEERPEDGRTFAEQLIEKYITEAIDNNDGQAIRDLIDRIDGKAMQKMQVSNDKDSEWLELMKGIAGETVTETGEDT